MRKNLILVHLLLTIAHYGFINAIFHKEGEKNRMIKIRVRTKYWTAYSIEHRGILRSLLNIYVETFCENRSALLAWIFLLTLTTPLEGVLANYLKNIYRIFTKYSSLSSNLLNFQKQPKSCCFTWRKLCKNIKAIFVKPLKVATEGFVKIVLWRLASFKKNVILWDYLFYEIS